MRTWTRLLTNENPVVDSVFIDPERCADELAGN